MTDGGDQVWRDQLDQTVARLDTALRSQTARADRLEDLVGQLDVYSRDQAGALAELLPRVDYLAQVAESLDDGSERADETASGSGPVIWALLSADEAATAWDELARWFETIAVPTLAPTARDIPPCWPMHTWGRETLSWLHHTHQQAYSPQGSAFQVAEWHTQWVAQAYAALGRAAPSGNCDVPAHRSDRAEQKALLRTEDWGPWLVQARDADVSSRR